MSSESQNLLETCARWLSDEPTLILIGLAGVLFSAIATPVRTKRRRRLGVSGFLTSYLSAMGVLIGLTMALSAGTPSGVENVGRLAKFNYLLPAGGILFAVYSAKCLWGVSAPRVSDSDSDVPENESLAGQFLEAAGGFAAADPDPPTGPRDDRPRPSGSSIASPRGPV